MSTTSNFLNRPATLRLAGAVLSTMFVGAACTASTDSAGPTAGAPTTESTIGATARPPSIDGLQLLVADDVATLVAVVDDADGDLRSLEIDWGDGTTETLTVGAPTIRVDHRYAAGGRYVASIAATDATGLATIETAGASIDEVDAPSTTAPPAPTPTAPPAPTPTTAPTPAPTPTPTPTPARPSPSPSPSRS